jgi:hypothetical protein
LDNLQSELELWRGGLPDETEMVKAFGFTDWLHSAKPYPDVYAALRIILSLPATTAEAERSFSTMRRLKSWLRSTMTSERLSHLAILNVHAHRITTELIESVVSQMANGNVKRRMSWK